VRHHRREDGLTRGQRDNLVQLDHLGEVTGAEVGDFDHVKADYTFKAENVDSCMVANLCCYDWTGIGVGDVGGSGWECSSGFHVTGRYSVVDNPVSR
jgi:hypothetical protein